MAPSTSRPKPAARNAPLARDRLRIPSASKPSPPAPATTRSILGVYRRLQRGVVQTLGPRTRFRLRFSCVMTAPGRGNAKPGTGETTPRRPDRDWRNSIQPPPIARTDFQRIAPGLTVPPTDPARIPASRPTARSACPLLGSMPTRSLPAHTVGAGTHVRGVPRCGYRRCFEEGERGVPGNAGSAADAGAGPAVVGFRP